MDVKNVATRAAAESPDVVREYQDKMRAVLTRSAIDREFRRHLVEHPREAIAEATGEDIDAFDVRFVENTADATIVLPEFVDADAELSESELEAVAGGSEPIAIGLLAFAGSMAIGAWVAQATK